MIGGGAKIKAGRIDAAGHAGVMDEHDRSAWLHDRPHRTTLDPTRARPQPWFVGNGRGLMIGVLAVVGLLIVLRALSMLWLAEAAWSWAISTDRREAVPAAAPPAPPPGPDLHDWIRPADYPPAALAARQEGAVELGWEVARDGRVVACRVIRGSGHDVLDDAVCPLLRERARYRTVGLGGRQDLRRFSAVYRWRLPPLPDGRVAVPARGVDEAAWITPNDYPPLSIRDDEQGVVRIRWTIGTDGRVHDCRATESSGYLRLDRAACAAITYRGRYRPARDAQGRAVATEKSRRVAWRLPD